MIIDFFTKLCKHRTDVISIIPHIRYNLHLIDNEQKLNCRQINRNLISDGVFLTKDWLSAHLVSRLDGPVQYVRIKLSPRKNVALVPYAIPPSLGE